MSKEKVERSTVERKFAYQTTDGKFHENVHEATNHQVELDYLARVKEFVERHRTYTETEDLLLNLFIEHKDEIKVVLEPVPITIR